jgi:glutamate synthase (NADPH/NADH) large chain
MAELGFRRLDDMVGRVDCIVQRPADGRPPLAKARRLDFSEVLYSAAAPGTPLHCVEAQDHNLSRVKDRELMAEARAAIDGKERVVLSTPIRNSDRAFGAMLSGEIARAHGAEGLADDSIRVKASGSAGQSFGAFAARGLTLELTGDANDYVGKGLSGGTLVVRPPRESAFRADDQVIVGNTVLYGATSGRAFFNGRAGERFAVRNSGATAVVEGVGDHGCEYMTGGIVVVLGTTGRNFGAGMSGGMAYVFDEDAAFVTRCNREMVALEALEPEEAENVRHLIEEHAMRTGSPKAHELLDCWAAVVPKMVKVMPSEYKRILAEKLTPETAGRPVTGAIEPPPARPYVPTGAWQRAANSTGEHPAVAPRVAHG